MTSIYNIIGHIIGLLGFLVIFQSVMYFLSIDVSSYLLYLAWFIALILFYYLLPGKYRYFSEN